MDIEEEVKALSDELLGLRRDFHSHPELGYQEYRSSEIICRFLEACGLETRRAAKTGVVGLLRGKAEGPTLMLRADMDALAVQEQNDIPYRSQAQGKMHACGHDGHMAMLLVAAKILSGHRDRFRGNLKFVFQPNEEDVGAMAMIEEGVLEDPKVDACLGVHLWSLLEAGKIGISAGAVMAGIDHFKLEVLGKGGHTGVPHQAVDPILCAADLIQSFQMVQTREIDALKPTVIMFGRIEGGTRSNVIPERVTLEGTARYLYRTGEGANEDLRGRLERIADGVCRAHRTEYRLDFKASHPALINDRFMTELVKSEAQSVLSKPENIVDFVTMAGDDFAEFAARVPGAYYFIGAGNERKGASFPHHHARFNIDEDVLPLGALMHVRTALRYLNG